MQECRRLRLESLEARELLAVCQAVPPDGQAVSPDVNKDGLVSPIDALLVINHLNGPPAADPSMLDVNHDGDVSPADALAIINEINGTAVAADAAFGAMVTPGFEAQLSDRDMFSPNQISSDEVCTLLSRASMATKRTDAIIAVVDRGGRILGVRVEKSVSANLQNDPDKLAFAIDGAVAKARTAAFFSSNAAPLTSRTIRFISQSTITQREVESSPLNADPRYQGPGLVAPIGVGGHFPPEIAFTPQVDLFAIEHQSRDSQTHPGLDRKKGTVDDVELMTRFNANPNFVSQQASGFFTTWPESYGEQSGKSPNAIPRGIGTLPGGVPLFKLVEQAKPGTDLSKPSEQINLVGGIGVFFPGEDGFATHEQEFVHASQNGGVTQTEKDRTNAGLVLEAEFAALIAAAGGGILAFEPPFDRDLTEFNDKLPELKNFVLPSGRIDLVGVTLEIYGPTPDRDFRKPGIDRLIEVGRNRFMGRDSGDNQQIFPNGATVADGEPVPFGWLVAPHANGAGGLTATDVENIINAGRESADDTRAAIRLDFDNGGRPGSRTRMVLAVADKEGEILGLYRQEDATIFSIDVSVAKARNTAYYADANAIVAADRIDFDGDGMFGPVTWSVKTRSGDSVPKGTALTNRSFRFLVEPRFPTGSELDQRIGDQLVNNPNISLCDREPQLCLGVGPQSALRLPGINPLTAENIRDDAPLHFNVYASPNHSSTVAYDSFNVMTNFRDPGDADVTIGNSDVKFALANQNGVVFFPGSTPLYIRNRTKLAGGFGVSGDGVDQDDVVTSAGQTGFDPLQSIRIDSYTIGGVRVPFQKFNRNPDGP
ncbi:MAG: hypothetical protein KDB27_06235 [Planctomycetales bacterium]|nr:hypothetical protein [Planctomycetales bacterium]